MKRVVLLVGFIAILVAAYACGGGGSSAGPGNLARTPSGSENGTTAPVKGQPDQAGGGGSTAFNPASDVVPPLQGPRVIRQAQLAISVKSGAFDTALADVRRLVEFQGGFISGTDAQANPATNEKIRTGVVTFIVPADKFDATIDQLATMGKVQSEHISGSDVSAQYVDLQARLVNAQAQRDAMLALLRKAQTVSDIIAVQNQLGQITAQIEQLRGQISYLEHNTAFSTITVSLFEAGVPSTTTPVDSWGFVSALSDAAHNFVTTINYIISGLGALGPILILLGLGFLLWRRRAAFGLRRI